MSSSSNSPARPPLTGFRVIDLATTRGELAGRTLADLGAEVIKIEPPEGAQARRWGPFDERPGPANGESLYWAALGRGKKSVALDIHAPAARAKLAALVATADVFIESFDPGTLAPLGLDYASLAAINPALVYASITPFGQDGPMAHAPASELTIEAAGGLVSLQGDDDRPNIPVGYPQSSFHAGAQAAADIAIALFEREQSGLGQYLDVSMQAGMVWTLMNATGFPPNQGCNPPGHCEARALPKPQLFPGVDIPRIWECADGYMLFTIGLAAIGARTQHATMQWAEEHGALPPELCGLNWLTMSADVAEGRLDPALIGKAVDALKAFFKTKTQVEIQAFATRTGVIMGAIYDIPALLADPHLKARDYWREVGGRIHPGPFVRPSRTPLAETPPAPALGASQALLDDTAHRPAVTTSVNGTRKAAFEGLKVADFAWVGVGPIISKALADHGATVVHVESVVRPDVLRLAAPFKNGEAGIDNAQFMANFNSSKLGLAANLGTPEGRQVARRLIDWADVVVESFTPGTMARWGLDWDTISQGRPDLVMLSTCLRGQSGPEAPYTGFGGQGAALSGLHWITGWPDRPPAGPWGAYTDFINPRFGVATVTSAILQQRRTGLGQHIDLAQTEAGIHFLEPLVLDYTVNGRAAPRMGHDSLYAAPHGVFRAAGTERYIAIATETGEQWRALCSIAPLSRWCTSEFDALSARQAQKTAIEDALRAWCEPQDAFELAGTLRDAGVPAYPVLRPTDLYEDPQLAHRGFFVTLNHSNMGPTPYDGLVTKFSATPGKLRRAGPCLGEHTHQVLTEFLGMDEIEVAELAATGALA